jgi:signal transduction histidine kinase
MNARMRQASGWSIWILTVVLAGATVWLAVLNGTRLYGQDLPAVQDIVQAIASLGFATVGTLIVSRRANAVGWLLSSIGLGLVLFPFTEEYTLRALVTGPGSLPGAQWAAWIHSWAPFLSVGAVPMLFLLFPDGHPPSRRWRPFGWVLGGGAAFLLVGGLLGSEELQGYYTHFTPTLKNPVGIVGSGGPWVVFIVIISIMFLAAIGCVAALLTRFSRSAGEERQQLKWVAYAGAVMGVLGLAIFAVSASGRESGLSHVIVMMFLFTVGVGLPAAIAVAVFKYRLYDLDFVVKKTVMFGTLAAFMSLVYLGIVVWLGSSLHGQSDNNVLVYSAAAVVAVGFQPVRSRAGRLADRIVYGKRATPYDVLSDLAHRMSDAYSVEDVLPKMVEAMASATGATRIGVWLRFDSEFRPVATWPHDLLPESMPIAWEGKGLPVFDGWDRVYAVSQQGELLGAITLVERPSDPMVPAKERLTLALAAQAGLVLRNVRLFEDLKASRQRLVTAQDEERRRLERNIHDGAQQRLLTLAVAVGLTRDRVADPALCDELDRVGEELRVTLNELRELARGTYPAILTEAGLGPALESVVQRASVPATLASAPEGRLPAQVEATAYFVVSEALANAAKHANASSVTVSARLLDGHLVVEVTDDGVGGAQATGGSGLKGLADRLAALDGSLRLESSPGAGTRVVAEIPVP